MVRCLFVDAFHGGSHRAFAAGLRERSAHEIELLTLPGGEWRRRMRRGAQDVAAAAADLAGPFDVIICTDMLDLPAFLALTRPRFAETPVLLFMHENQFTYPRLRGTKLNSWFGQQNYLSALAADTVAFNSEYHRRDFLAALHEQAARPNNWLAPGWLPALEEKGTVLPVGVDLAWFDRHRPDAGAQGLPMVLWNHRWEFDKAPEMFVRAARALAAEGLAFRVAVAGEPGDNPVPALVRLREELPGHVVHHGYLPTREAYARLLWESGICVSTTRHEFFGVAMVEALYCGCWPVAPARFNYPALVPAGLHRECLFEDEAGFVRLLREAILRPGPAPAALRASAARFDWGMVAPAWDSAIGELAKRSRGRLSPGPAGARL